MRHGLLFSILLVSACEGEKPSPTCTITDATRVPAGSAKGHADPAGARAAGQARAGRIDDLAQVRRAADARHPVRTGDYLLANDKIAMYIEGARRSDGYTPFGGEPLAVDRVGDDGLPRGTSQYGEMLLSISGQVVAPDSVTVIADGSDGKAAVVRSSGVLKQLPFLDSFAGIFGDRYPFPAAVDYVLEPGSERVQIRLHLLNTEPVAISLAGAQVFGFFHSYRGRTFTTQAGFGPLDGLSPPFVAWDAGTSAFAFRSRGGIVMKFLTTAAGVDLFLGSGGELPTCTETVLDYAEVIPADSLDELLETIRRIDGEVASRTVSISVRDAGGAVVPGALVHALAAGTYLTRAAVDATGTATLHVPAAEVTLEVTAPGYAMPSPTTLAAGASTITITLGAVGTIQIEAKEVGSGAALPVRVTVLPKASPASVPPSFGVDGEAFDRLHQVFAETGKATLVVPPGEYRVVVSRGYEYELDDRTVTITAGTNTKLDAQLAHSVDTTGVQCADFHIHSFYSVDSSDRVLDKVRSALAEGVDIPVSSEHEYVIDFQPIIEQLGMTKWAHGLSSEELTTFAWGHFGVVPKMPDLSLPNRGAVDWVGNAPAAVFAKVHALPEQPALIVNHPYSGSVQGYLTAASFNEQTGTGDPTLYSEDYDAIEVFNDSDLSTNRDASVAGWFSVLNHGKRAYAVGSSDSHHARTTPVGYPRTCLALGFDDPALVTPEAVRDAVKNGTSTIDGGLYLTVEGPGGVRPGDTIPSPGAKLAFDVAIQAPSWIDAQTLEVIVDGVTVQTIPLVPSIVPGPGKRWEAPIEIDLPSAGTPGGLHYVIFHAASSQDLSPVAPGRRAFAVSNPIFF